LNNLANITNLKIETENNLTYSNSKISFRDFVSFLFQPQYLIANQRTLLYKTDSYQNREKLKSIFPYVLGAVNNQTLRLENELISLQKEIKKVEKLYELSHSALNKWLGEIKGYYLKAKEYGLLKNKPDPKDYWTAQQYIDNLKLIPRAVDLKGIPYISIGETSKITSRLSELHSEEIRISSLLESYREKQAIVKKIRNTNNKYSQSILDQKDRLSTVDWFIQKFDKNDVCPFCGSKHNNNDSYLKSLKAVTLQIKQKAAKVSDINKIFDQEILDLNNKIKECEEKINQIRQEIRIIEKEDEKIRNHGQTINNIYRFVGDLESKLDSYNNIMKKGKLNVELELLRNKESDLIEEIRKQGIQKKKEEALKIISKKISYYANLFNAERCSSEILLDLTDLNVAFLQNGKKDYLWEIGSGANYMAYHISVLLGLHEWFLMQKNSPIPNFIIFDQPSQAFFPEIKIKSEEQIEKSEDIENVKNIFNVLTRYSDDTLPVIPAIPCQSLFDFSG
jgi:hypothetical protein